MRRLSIGSLFSGIGGLELGLEWAGLGPVRWQCEIDPYCRKVLAKHWPDAIRYEDVRAVENPPAVDILCGGFPCQDLSQANPAGRGLEGARSGLWFEYLRVVRDVRPRFVVVENVPGLVRRGLDVVVSGLSDAGYTVEATRIRASDVGAPHRRERIFIVAHAAESRREVDRSDARAGAPRGALPDASGPHVADATRWGKQRRARAAQTELSTVECGSGGPSEPRLGRASHGLSGWLDGRWVAPPGPYQHPWEPPRTVPARSVPNRAARVAALGNAVVPHCAMVAGFRIQQILRSPP